MCQWLRGVLQDLDENEGHKHTACFKDNDITGRVLLSLTKDDLRVTEEIETNGAHQPVSFLRFLLIPLLFFFSPLQELGITSFGVNRTILLAIDQLKQTTATK